MKKLLLLLLIFSGLTVSASEITEDYLDIASNYCVYGNYNEALNYLNKILELEPQNSQAKYLQNTLLQIKKSDVNSSKTVIKSDYTQSELSRAQAFISQKNYDNAISILNEYIAKHPNSDIAYALRAEVYMHINNLQAAQNDIKKALSIEESIPYLLTEAKILYHIGKHEDAKIKLKMLVRNLQTSDVYKYIGLCDYAEKNYSSALLNIDKAIILSDDDKSLNSIYNEVKNMLEQNG